MTSVVFAEPPLGGICLQEPVLGLHCCILSLLADFGAAPITDPRWRIQSDHAFLEVWQRLQRACLPDWIALEGRLQVPILRWICRALP